MKQCTKCKEWKELEEFHKSKNTKDGRRFHCKECRRKEPQRKEYKKQWHEDNKEYVKQREKQNYENNKEYKKQCAKQYREDNKEYVKNWKREYYHSPLGFGFNSTLEQEIEKYEKIRESQNGNVECICAYCGEWFEPLKSEIVRRIRSINGDYGKGTESKLYCSNKCKQNCPTYKQRIYPKDQKPATSREVQPQLRQIVFERDNYTCQKCSNHKSELEVGIHCHHIEPVNESPITSADEDNCITLCEDCHKEVHQIPGCTYSELRCNY